MRFQGIKLHIDNCVFSERKRKELKQNYRRISVVLSLNSLRLMNIFISH
jgi:hypothetical protein